MNASKKDVVNQIDIMHGASLFATNVYSRKSQVAR